VGSTFWNTTSYSIANRQPQPQEETEGKICSTNMTGHMVDMILCCRWVMEAKDLAFKIQVQFEKSTYAFAPYILFTQNKRIFGDSNKMIDREKQNEKVP
jgi:hypothetical protein